MLWKEEFSVHQVDFMVCHLTNHVYLILCLCFLSWERLLDWEKQYVVTEVFSGMNWAGNEAQAHLEVAKVLGEGRKVSACLGWATLLSGQLPRDQTSVLERSTKIMGPVLPQLWLPVTATASHTSTLAVSILRSGFFLHLRELSSSSLDFMKAVWSHCHKGIKNGHLCLQRSDLISFRRFKAGLRLKQVWAVLLVST